MYSSHRQQSLANPLHPRPAAPFASSGASSLTIRAIVALGAVPPIPRLTPSGWLSVLSAPQGHINTRRDYAARVEDGLRILHDPAVAGLAAWAGRTWPGWTGRESLAAMAGVLAVAPDLQRAVQSGPIDQAWAAELIAGAVETARAAALRRSPAGSSHRPGRTVAFGVDVNSVEAAATERSPDVASQWAEAMTEWVTGQVAPVSVPNRAALVLDANFPLFWTWYGKRMGTDEIASGAFPPPPPARQLGAGQRLEDCLGGACRGVGRASLRAVARVLLGPPRRNGWSAEKGWQMGVGYWSLMTLRAWAAQDMPKPPPAKALRWWSPRLDALAAMPAPWELSAVADAGVAVA
jgi:hypothetical protein